MRTTNPVTLACVLVGLALAGCADKTQSTEETEIEGVCDFTYPDGSPVPCETEAITRAFQERPLGAVCNHEVHYPGEFTVRRWSDATGRHWLDGEADRHGTFRLLAWNETNTIFDVPAGSFVEVTGSEDLSARVYGLTPNTLNVEVESLWSEYEGKMWHLTKVLAPEPMYYHATGSPGDFIIEVDGRPVFIDYLSFGDVGISMPLIPIGEPCITAYPGDVPPMATDDPL